MFEIEIELAVIRDDCKKFHTHCKSYSRDLLDVYIEERIMLLPFPIPYDEFKNIDVIYKNSKY